MKIRLITRIRYRIALWIDRRKDDLDSVADIIFPDPDEIGANDFEKGRQFDEAIRLSWWKTL
jgi:hypothetical protein